MSSLNEVKEFQKRQRAKRRAVRQLQPTKADAARAMLAALRELLQEAEKTGWAEAGYTDNAKAAIAAAEAAGIGEK